MPEEEMETTANAVEQAGTSKKKEYVNVKVVGQNASEVHFRLKMTTPMHKLKKSYSERTGTDIKNLRFLFDGARINDTDTPEQLGLEDDDGIEVFQEQTGGCRRN